MALKTSKEVTGYDLSTTGTIAEINTDTLLEIGWQIEGNGSADYKVQIQPENSSNWYDIEAYSGVNTVDDGAVAPEAFRTRIKNTSTVNDTADVVLGGATDDN